MMGFYLNYCFKIFIILDCALLDLIVINLSNTTFSLVSQEMQKSKKKMKFLLNKSLSMNEDLTAFNKLITQPINEEDEYEEEGGQKKQVKREIGIFEEFKIKYDLLRKENLQKRSQIDDLNRVNKRLQIQLLNINTEFYDRQIKRLRTEVEKYQEECEDFKFKYFQAENKRKQFESSLNLKEKEVSTSIKQIQVQKVQNAELKLQNKQKQRQYMKIISTVEQSSNKSSERYIECEGKLSAVQSQLKKTKIDLQSEKKNVQKLQKSRKELEEENKKLAEKQKIQVGNLNKSLEDSQNRCIQYRKEISNLKEQISTLTLDLTKSKSLFDFETNKTFEKITQFRSSKILQIQNKKFKQEIQALKIQREHKSLSFNTLRNQMNQSKSQLQLQKKQYDQKLQDLQNKKIAIEKYYESKNISLNKQIQTLKVKCIKLESFEANPEMQHRGSNSTFSQGKNSLSSKKSQETNPLLAFQNQFQIILAGKDNQIKLLKQTLNQKNQEIFKLKQQLEDLQISTQDTKSEIKILEKKLSVQQKNILSRHQIEVIEMKNQIQILKRKLSQAETRVEVKKREIKEKDSFITNSVISRVQKQEDVTLVLAEMQRVLQSDFIEKLVDAEGKIKLLEAKIPVC